MTIESEPDFQFEQEPDEDSGFVETLVFFAATGLTFGAGVFRGQQDLLGFAICAILAGLGYAWLIWTGDPTDSNDKGL